MILVDTNILMYAAGADHPNKRPSTEFLERVASDRIQAAIDTEALQEILHRYLALGRGAEGRQVYDGARRLFAVPLPATVEVMDRARGFLDQHPQIGARDAMHAAIVVEHGLSGICSYDRGFDALSAVLRFEPDELA